MKFRQPLLTVEGVTVEYALPRFNPFSKKRLLKAVDQVHFELHAGEVLGLVGESGCGKSSLARALLGLLPVSSGKIVFSGRDMVGSIQDGSRKNRQKMQMIFQDPLASLNPRMTAGSIIAEPLRVCDRKLDRRLVQRKVMEMMERVGLSNSHGNRYPHQFSGGQCQRIGIARALITKPQFLICDEAVSALDVSIQAQIINLLAELRDEMGLALLFISHDLRVVKAISDRVMVMYLGRIVEINATQSLYRSPRHPYTKTLLKAILNPVSDRDPGWANNFKTSELPSALKPPSGCAFHPRCPLADPLCSLSQPRLRLSEDKHGQVACHRA